MRERLKKLIDFEGLTNLELEKLTGISAYKWGNLLTGKQRVNEDHIKALDKIYPQYTYWLASGKTLPEADQISPEIEQARKNSEGEGREAG